MDRRHSHHLIEIRYQQWFMQSDRYIFKWGKKNANSQGDITFLLCHHLPSICSSLPRSCSILDAPALPRAIFESILPVPFLHHTPPSKGMGLPAFQNLLFLASAHPISICTHLLLHAALPLLSWISDCPSTLWDQCGFALKNLKGWKGFPLHNSKQHVPSSPAATHPILKSARSGPKAKQLLHLRTDVSRRGKWPPQPLEYQGRATWQSAVRTAP